ncbi:hypothetical protein N7527_003512 [Penicillium freii]|nr:hypothetical protein N7527_003512 [Penicillium freii]
MFSATSFAEPKLSELVPTLTGESNFALWSTALKHSGSLSFRDPHRPYSLARSRGPLPSRSRHLLLCLHATIHTSLKPYINTALNTYTVYQSLFKTFAVHTYIRGFDKFNNLLLSNIPPTPNSRKLAPLTLILLLISGLIAFSLLLANYLSIFLSSDNAPAKLKHFYTFYQRKAAYTSEEYFKNPANANTAKLVNAINAPALTNNNPVVRYNNLFNN